MELKKIRKTAKSILFCDGNYVRMILFSALSLFTVVAPVLLSTMVSTLCFGTPADDNTSALTGYSLVLLGVLIPSVFLLAVPTLIRLKEEAFRRFERTAHGIPQNPERSLSYRRRLALSLTEFLRALVSVLIPLVLILIVSVLIEHSRILAVLLAPVWLVLIVALLFLAPVITCGWFLVPYYCFRGHSLRLAVRYSRQAMRENRMLYLRWLLSFTPQILLSIVTIGVFFLLYTKPLMTTSYFVFADRLAGRDVIERENSK